MSVTYPILLDQGSNCLGSDEVLEVRIVTDVAHLGWNLELLRQVLWALTGFNRILMLNKCKTVIYFHVNIKCKILQLWCLKCKWTFVFHQHSNVIQSCIMYCTGPYISAYYINTPNNASGNKFADYSLSVLSSVCNVLILGLTSIKYGLNWLKK